MRGLWPKVHTQPPSLVSPETGEKLSISIHQLRGVWKDAPSGMLNIDQEQTVPRVDVIHNLSEEEKICECGAVMCRIGQESCEKLDYIPAKVRVLNHIRFKYACKKCQGVDSNGPTVKIAPPPVQLIPKSMATEGLLAHIAVSKFDDALPLYRQQKIFNRLGVELSRTTMANWLVHAAVRCGPLIDPMQNQMTS